MCSTTVFPCSSPNPSYGRWPTPISVQLIARHAPTCWPTLVGFGDGSDAREAEISARLAELHAADGGAPVADVHTRCGGVSAAEGKRRERRAETLGDAPAFGDALGEGRIGAEHVDALAGVTSRLDDDVRSELFGLADDLLTDAERLSPEQFGRSVRELARRLEANNGIERNERQRRETFLTRKLNPATGMTEGRFALHPELANQLFGAVDREVAAMVAEGERSGDAQFVERRVDRNRLAAEALGRLVGSGHDRERPLEADITVVIDADTLATSELLRPLDVRDQRRRRTPTSVRAAPALHRTSHAGDRRRVRRRARCRTHDPPRQPSPTPSAAGHVPMLRIRRLRRAVRSL